jgi:hypothetical protein
LQLQGREPLPSSLAVKRFAGYALRGGGCPARADGLAQNEKLDIRNGDKSSVL